MYCFLLYYELIIGHKRGLITRYKSGSNRGQWSHMLKKHVQEIRNLHWCMCSQLCSLTGQLCLKVS